MSAITDKFDELVTNNPSFSDTEKANLALFTLLLVDTLDALAIGQASPQQQMLIADLLPRLLGQAQREREAANAEN